MNNFYQNNLSNYKNLQPQVTQNFPQSTSFSQPLFPQPNGNVYTINNALEVANVPIGMGISVALCPQENIMYIKSLQNGNPTFCAYKIEPYEESNPATPQGQGGVEERLSKIEEALKEMKDKGEWPL